MQIGSISNLKIDQNLVDTENTFKVNSVKFNSFVYKPGSVIQIDQNSYFEPNLGIIENILYNSDEHIYDLKIVTLERTVIYKLTK